MEHDDRLTTSDSSYYLFSILVGLAAFAINEFAVRMFIEDGIPEEIISGIFVGGCVGIIGVFLLGREKSTTPWQIYLYFWFSMLLGMVLAILRWSMLLLAYE